MCSSGAVFQSWSSTKHTSTSMRDSHNSRSNIRAYKRTKREGSRQASYYIIPRSNNLDAAVQCQLLHNESRELISSANQTSSSVYTTYQGEYPRQQMVGLAQIQNSKVRHEAHIQTGLYVACSLINCVIVGGVGTGALVEYDQKKVIDGLHYVLSYSSSSLVISM